MVFSVMIEDSWLKKKLSENTATFAGLLQADTAYRQRSSLIHLPKSLAVKQGNLNANVEGELRDSLRAGGSFAHRYDRSAGCAWNSALCKI
mmetsp:Transcript_48215/g.100778  ORF Transcript_48215/g.100778 Transcript_48215/m.100778 type:complete len:91 (-) Transcript_48215:26-298(-)